MTYDMAFLGVAAVLLVAAVKIMVPKLLSAENPNVKFVLGIGLFLIYNLALGLLMYWLCTFDGTVIPHYLVSRMLVGWLLTMFATLFGGALYFFSRERRSISQREKMKLKDL